MHPTTRRRALLASTTLALAALVGCAEGVPMDSPDPGDLAAQDDAMPSLGDDASAPAATEPAQADDPSSEGTPSDSMLTVNAGDSSSSGAGDGGAGSSHDSPGFLHGFFPLAVDFQPHQDFERWTHRGINTVIRVPGSDNVGDWTREAHRLGLHMIRQPASNPRDDVHDDLLLAWHWMDEPELHGAHASDLEDFRRRMHDIDPTRPISVNFWGGGMLEADSHGCAVGHCYPDYIHHADWLSDDIYPCNRADLYHCNVTLIGRMVHQLRAWGDHQAVFAYIEASHWEGNGWGRAPTPGEFRAEVWDAIVHGARGVFYFPERIRGGCSSNCLADYDAMPNDLVDEMTRVNARVTRVANALQTSINPDGASIDVGGSLEATWRRYDGAWWFVVLNTSGNAVHHARLRLHGVHATGPAKVVDEGRNVRVGNDDVIADDFGAHDVHVYMVQ